MLMPTKEDIEFVTEDIESTRVVAGVGVKGNWVLCNQAHWVKLMKAAAYLECRESIKILG